MRTPSTRRRRLHSSLASQFVLIATSFVEISSLNPSFKASPIQHNIAQEQDRHPWAAGGCGVFASDTRRSTRRYIPSKFPLRASASDGDDNSSGSDKVAIEVKKSLRNPVDTAQVNSCGSTFYASGYDEVNKEGYVLMQTLSGVAPDGREVVAVVAPGKYTPGKSVLVESRHVVDKPKGLDWERAAMLPFLVRAQQTRRGDKILCSLKFYNSTLSYPRARRQ